MLLTQRLSLFVKCLKQISFLFSFVQKNPNNLDILAFWLANTSRLLHDMKQYSGDRVGGQFTSACMRGNLPQPYTPSPSVCLITSLFFSKNSCSLSLRVSLGSGNYIYRTREKCFIRISKHHEVN